MGSYKRLYWKVDNNFLLGHYTPHSKCKQAISLLIYVIYRRENCIYLCRQSQVVFRLRANNNQKAEQWAEFFKKAQSLKIEDLYN